MQSPPIMQSPVIGQSSPMTTSPSPLDQLADIHLPTSLSWWPLAPGWWLLLGLLAVALLVAIFWWRKRARNRYRVVAQRALDTLYGQYQQDQNASEFLHNLSVLLRRTALTAQPQQFSASIKGRAWLEWLDACCPDGAQGFCSPLGDSLISSAYQKTPQVDAAALYHLASHWIARHRNQYQTSSKATVKPREEATHV